MNRHRIRETPIIIKQADYSTDLYYTEMRYTISHVTFQELKNIINGWFTCIRAAS